ncbi:MAG TPA: hypothetical protein PK629_10900 [Oscillospiraceae bacterium]|nr:hypothetical protein [Oscillospiraceae bacterium]HPF55035.1 hypothetical protein [Clostridiales bacterium]HPK35795.1 hypothetical protein [Oscillospiraceae bacterium]HPR75415.1 hypothetical protein [Oscillospiraceae bacterium]
MPEYNDKDLIKMQNDAMKRVMEMQRRAKESYSAAQSPAATTGQNAGGPVFSSLGPTAQETFSHQSKSDMQNPIPCPDLVKQLFILLGTDDPILNAALAYLL